MEVLNLEFDENTKTNLINASIALRDAGLQNGDDWANLLGDSGVIANIYGNRAPSIKPRLTPRPSSLPQQGGSNYSQFTGAGPK